MGEYEIPKKIQRLHEDIHPGQLRYHQKRVAVRKEFTFDAAHHLHLYEGKCQSLHGHTYRLVITVSGIPDERGLCMDFADLKRIYEETIAKRLDHRYLNEVLPPMNTSAENLIVWIWEQLDNQLAHEGWKARGLRLEELCLYETPTSSAMLKREWMEDNGQ
ncbi:MAG: 6-carboxytetrahydropterin synthase QueD [Alicyclobacillus herbarius]|uniref:6-carboxytetrahydropterin synthase QueD n=1 Tax=Alicyclobacillus herbarius TaxID=122960 RepID=UPI0003FBAE7B|nr:6-carboxytetrahydropterin synthase QueD [Alicyclobacillus herbarius]MCL6631550.1 6-carboxytetrahydropterin synthase QueD [Alicyclobacillus herbarius]